MNDSPGTASNAEASGRQVIEAKMHDIVEDINDSRKQHNETMANFKKDLEKQVRNQVIYINNKNCRLKTVANSCTVCAGKIQLQRIMTSE